MPSKNTRRDLSVDRLCIPLHAGELNLADIHVYRKRQGNGRKRKSRDLQRLLRSEAARQSNLNTLKECLDLVESWDHDPSTPRSMHLSGHEWMAEHKPQVVEKCYANVRVFEMSIGTCALMMRCCDSWVNATQILDLAGIKDKHARIKTLRREIWPGEHQKVQGGWAKYQGTWISYERGIMLCRQYGLEHLLEPLLNRGSNRCATEIPYENHPAVVSHGLSSEIREDLWDADNFDFSVTIEPDVLEPAAGRPQSSLTSNSFLGSTEVDVYVFDKLNENKQADFLFDFSADLSHAWTEEAVREAVQVGISHGMGGESDEGRLQELEKASMDIWIAQKGYGWFRRMKNLNEDWDASTQGLLGSESEVCVVVDLCRHS